MSEGKFCVYSHAANGQVFYVGSGRRVRAHDRGNRTPRWYEHVFRNPAYEVKIIHETEDRAEAIAIEEQLIKELSPALNVRGKVVQLCLKFQVKHMTAIRLRPATKAALKKAAEADGRSMMNLVERVMEDWLKVRGFLK